MVFNLFRFRFRCPFYIVSSLQELQVKNIFKNLYIFFQTDLPNYLKMSFKPD